MLWDAFYALVPFNPTEKIELEALATLDSIRFRTDVEPTLPPECKLNQPIEDSKPLSPGSKKSLVNQLMTALALAGKKIKGT